MRPFNDMIKLFILMDKVTILLFILIQLVYTYSFSALKSRLKNWIILIIYTNSLINEFLLYQIILGLNCYWVPKKSTKEYKAYKIHLGYIGFILSLEVEYYQNINLIN